MIRNGENKGHRGQLLPPLVTLWAATLILGGATMFPLLRATPNTWDDQVFSPGGMTLLEALRLHREPFLSGMRTALLLFLSAQTLLLLIRGRLTAVIVDASFGRAARSGLLSRAPSYLAFTALKLIALGLCLLLLRLTVGGLPHFSGVLPPPLVLAHLFVLALGLFWWVAIATLFDLVRLSLFHEDSLQGRLQLAWETFLGTPLKLVSIRAGFSLLGLGAGALSLWLSSSPAGASLSANLGTFLSTQGLVAATLGAEVLWLEFAQGHLRRNRLEDSRLQTEPA